MWDNIGGKIKTLAKVIFWVQSVLALIGVILSWFIVNWRYLNGTVIILIILGSILALAIAILIFWVCSFLLYGFGQLIESSEGTAYNTQQIIEQNNTLLRMNDATAAAATQIQRSLHQMSQDEQQRELHK